MAGSLYRSAPRATLRGQQPAVSLTRPQGSRPRLQVPMTPSLSRKSPPPPACIRFRSRSQAIVASSRKRPGSVWRSSLPGTPGTGPSL